jgi:D-alanyl-D-alanine carboxypeptidase (penicillin-binding protein 5/6)
LKSDKFSFMPSCRFWLTCLLFFSAAANAQAPKSAVPPPEPTAVASFVLDVDSSRVLSSKNGHQRMFPASTTKMMTVLVAAERGDLNQVISASKKAAATGESGIGLLSGENHTLDELIRAAMIKSANDACVSIAEGVAGSEAKFVALMNKKAKELGCRDTNFVNPHGLHHPNHYSTAHDLAVIGRAMLKIPFLNEVARTKTTTIGGNWKIGPQRLLINRNKLLYRWNQSDGVKTGYTRQAGNCLVASATQFDPATRQPWRLIAVALKSRGGQSWPDCEILLKRGFASYKRQVVAKRGKILSESQIKGGAFALEAAPARDIVLPLRAQESETLSHKVHLFDLTAPIAKGRIVGRVEYFTAAYGAPRRLAELALTARDDVPQTLLARALPPVGNRLRPWHPAWRLAFMGLLCLGTATLLLNKRKNYVRRRPHSAFQPAQLDPQPGGQRTSGRTPAGQRVEPSRHVPSDRRTPRPRS